MADVNIPGLAALSGPLADDDKFEVYDTSALQNKHVEVHELLNKYASDSWLKRVAMLWEAMVYDNGNWSRDANGVLDDADVSWARFIEGATDGRYTGTADATWITRLKTVAMTYPDRSVTVTLSVTWDADGTASAPTITVT